MRPTVQIGGHRIGPGQPCFVIAEVGVNHNGDLDLAHRLIDIAAGVGADAVKFQTFTAALVASEHAPKAAYQAARDDTPTHTAMLRQFQLDAAAHRELKDHAELDGLVFISSAFDSPAVELLHSLDVAAIKIPSGEITNLQLLGEVAATGRPVLMSTGMSTLDEVAAAFSVFEAEETDVVLLHCVSNYPAAPSDSNLRAIDTLRTRFRVPVGWSDHTIGISVATAAVALGADTIEKHITLDREMLGPDHAASMDPGGFETLVRAIRDVEASLGTGIKAPAASEAETAAVARKSLHWRRALESGAMIDDRDIVVLRPGTGLSPAERAAIVGRRTSVATVAGTMVRIDEIEPDRKPT